MNRLGFAALALALGLSACQRDEEAINKKLDDISRRLTSIEGKIGAAPAAGAAARTQQARVEADPNAVYAVPIGESASIGSKTAKVTMIEAFTFT